jgi:hypothetical protein
MLKLPFRCPLLSLPEEAAPEQTAVSIIYLSSAEVQIPATFSNDSILVLLSPPVLSREVLCRSRDPDGCCHSTTAGERNPWYGGSPWGLPG